MKKIGSIIIFFLAQMTLAFAAPKTVVCTLLGQQNTISFAVPQKIGALPQIDFSYPVDTTAFSMRDGNLLLVAMDKEEKSRLRILISAQAPKNSTLYQGQFMTDSGGNELQLDNGPVSCKLK